MKKIINHKSYDTETATKVASWCNGCNWNDFNYVSEELYVTKKGNWFVFGEGGANTSYAEWGSNSRSGSSDIKTLSASEAMEWLEEKDQIVAIETYFSDNIEEA